MLRLMGKVKVINKTVEKSTLDGILSRLHEIALLMGSNQRKVGKLI